MLTGLRVYDVKSISLLPREYESFNTEATDIRTNAVEFCNVQDLILIPGHNGMEKIFGSLFITKFFDFIAKVIVANF